MELSDSFCDDFKKNACFRLDEGLRMIAISLEFLKEEELWEKPNEHLNSIGNLILHLCGNITQYVISGVGGVKDERKRDMEFQQKGIATIPQVRALLENTVDKAKETIDKTEVETLLQERKIQGFQLSGLGAVLHAVEHFSYHTGQIALWVKWLRNTDLNFYGGMDLNRLNK